MIRVIAIAVASLVVGAQLAQASGSELASTAEATLSLRQAVELVLERNPTFASQRAGLDAARARADSIALAPEYRVGLELENFAGTGDTSGTDSLEATLSLSGVFELGGKRDARRALGASQLDALQIEQQVRLLDVIAAVARSFIDVVEAEARIAVVAENTAVATRTLESVQERVTAARASGAELAKAQIGLLRGQLQERDAKTRLDVARATLARAWGDNQWTFGRTLADLYRLPPNAALGELNARLDAAPDLSLIASRARLEETRARLAATARRGDVGWSAGIRHLEAPGDQALVVGIALPLGTAVRAEPLEREAAAEVERSRYDAQARRNELGSTVFAAYQNLEQARFEVSTLRERTTPLAEEALRLTELGYRNGRYSLLELADAQTQLLEIRSETIDAAAQFFRVLIELERLTGTNVVETLSGI